MLCTYIFVVMKKFGIPTLLICANHALPTLYDRNLFVLISRFIFKNIRYTFIFAESNHIIPNRISFFYRARTGWHLVLKSSILADIWDSGAMYLGIQLDVGEYQLHGLMALILRIFQLSSRERYLSRGLWRYRKVSFDLSTFPASINRPWCISWGDNDLYAGCTFT